MTITETERLIIREMEAERDAEFIFRLLNTPKFLRFIGDRGVRSVDAAREFIETRYRESYRRHGFGLYTVDLKAPAGTPIGICGFVKRDSLEYPDIGFAFLPEFEGRGFGYESALAVLDHGRKHLGFGRLLAITSLENDASVKLLKKLGFNFDEVRVMPGEDKVNLFSLELSPASHDL